tara:strand:+ start:874 stop:1272 length:399 start_codon:yes stop_codon:yes gene_type:complete
MIKHFILKYFLQTNMLSGNDFMNLSNTCRDFRQYNTNECLKNLWHHGTVKSLKTALYVKNRLRIFSPYEILEEAPNREKEFEVVSAFRRLLSRKKMIKLSKRSSSTWLFLPEKIGQPRLVLGKRTRHCISLF